MRAWAASAARAFASTTITSRPERAHTSAMPDPISPPPTTPIRCVIVIPLLLAVVPIDRIGY